MADPENLYDNSHSTQLGAAAPAASHHAPYNYAPYSHPSNLSAFQPGASANSAGNYQSTLWLTNGLETADRRTQHSIQQTHAAIRKLRSGPSAELLANAESTLHPYCNLAPTRSATEMTRTMGQVTEPAHRSPHDATGLKQRKQLLSALDTYAQRIEDADRRIRDAAMAESDSASAPSSTLASAPAAESNLTYPVPSVSNDIDSQPLVSEIPSLVQQAYESFCGCFGLSPDSTYNGRYQHSKCVYDRLVHTGATENDLGDERAQETLLRLRDALMLVEIKDAEKRWAARKMYAQEAARASERNARINGRYPLGGF